VQTRQVPANFKEYLQGGDMSGKKRVHVIVTGRVQGVFFRAYTRDEAVKLGLTGWVRNKSDGTVEAIVEGEDMTVDKMINWFYKGSPHSHVEKVETEQEPPVGDMEAFEIHYY
jgi:acylphosphatase